MLKELKNELKYLAAKIRKDRAEVKANQRAGTYSGQPELEHLRFKFRHKHIAYCLLRGRTREQIEAKVCDHNKPDEDYIQELVEGYKNHIAILTGTLPRQEPITNLRRLYVIVDETLPYRYAAAQAGHAIAEYMLRNPTPMLGKASWANEVLILCKAPYSTIKSYAEQRAKDWVGFSEPDLGNRLTAVAGVQDVTSWLVKHLPLL